MSCARKLFQWLGMLAIVCAMGCASAYHDYECSVSCQYCVPPPLPYQQYDPGVCHAHAAAPYLTGTAGLVTPGSVVPTPADAIGPTLATEPKAE